MKKEMKNTKAENTNETKAAAKQFFIYNESDGFLLKSDSHVPEFGYGQPVVFDARRDACSAAKILAAILKTNKLLVLGIVG